MNYFEMYKAVWDFHKKFISSIKDDDKFWETVVDESTAISKNMENVNSLIACCWVKLKSLKGFAKR